ncbi:MAG: SAM-dependent DNA methyltransferase, partial [Bacteroidales bacterium]|nr:SAM-dependent DNA methyltransferase [Bacteroidales bacterium]
QIVSFIWSIADDVLRDVFLRGQYRDVILPMVVLRRLDALLEPTKDDVEQEIKESGLENLDEGVLKDITGLSYFNTSKWTLNRLKSQATDNNNILYDNFVEYLNGFSENVRDVLKNFEYYNKARKLADNDRLLSIIEKITDPRINLTDKEVKDPDGIMLPAMTNIGMGTVFEELLRRFNEENNEEAGEHFTPRDAISLLAHLVFEPVKDNLPKIVSLYDPACGSGGMLTESREYLLDIGVRNAAIQLYGTEINPETYAICKSDLIIKGVDPSGMHLGNTITDNAFSDKSFGYMITNPPYGKSWKTDKDKIYHDKTLLDHRFELSLTNFIGEEEVADCTPRTSDGQLLFVLEEVDKMKPLEYQPQGSRIASIHNGSSLFTGDAGSGESNIRRYLIENDLVDAIIQLPNNIFYNTGITTYIWLLTNRKPENRRGKVQLIDASQAYEKLRKNQGSRNCTITPEHRNAILKTYMDFVEKDADDDKIASKIFDGDDFRYYNVTIERPLRLRSQFNALKIDEMLYDKGELDLSKWLYQQYGERVFLGLESEVAAIKEYLNDNEIKMPDKKLAKLISVKEWQARRELMDAAKQLMHSIGTDVFMDYNVFAEKVNDAAKQLKLSVCAAQLKTIMRAMSETDPDAKPVVKKLHKVDSKDVAKLVDIYGVDEKLLSDYGFYANGHNYLYNYIEYETDSDFRDMEKIPVKEDIYEYFQREVRPYVADAWINLPTTKIGCEISFNKYFYKPVPLRSLEENERDILELDRQSQGFIQSLFNLM